MNLLLKAPNHNLRGDAPRVNYESFLLQIKTLMKTEESIFQARVFPSKKNEGEHLIVYGVDLLDDNVKSEDKVIGFINLEGALESDVLKDYLGASELSKAIDCNVITKSIPFSLTLNHLPGDRTWTPDEGKPKQVYNPIRAMHIVSVEDLIEDED